MAKMRINSLITPELEIVPQEFFDESKAELNAPYLIEKEVCVWETSAFNYEIDLDILDAMRPLWRKLWDDHAGCAWMRIKGVSRGSRIVGMMHRQIELAIDGKPNYLFFFLEVDVYPKEGRGWEFEVLVKDWIFSIATHREMPDLLFDTPDVKFLMGGAPRSGMDRGTSITRSRISTNIVLHKMIEDGSIPHIFDFWNPPESKIYPQPISFLSEIAKSCEGIERWAIIAGLLT